jgi:putative endonuclease
MYFVYVLRSEATGRHYVGHTSDLTQRLGQHNNGITKSTKNRGPWKLIYQESFPTKWDAMQRERFLKTGQGRAELKRLLPAMRPAGWCPPAAEIRRRWTGSSPLRRVSGRTINF